MIKTPVYFMLFLSLSLVGCANTTQTEATSSTSFNNTSTQKPMTHKQNNLDEKEIKLTLIETYKGFQAPTGIAVDKEGQIYVSNWSGNSVTKIDTLGNYTTFVEGMGSPAGLAFDNNGILYVADYSKNIIYRVTKDGVKSIFAENLHTPTGISFNQEGELLLANRSSNEIVKIDTSGNIELVANDMDTPVGVVENADKNIYVTNYGGNINKILTDGTNNIFSTDFVRPGVGIGVSPQNSIVAVDNGDSCVRQIFPNGSTNVILNNIAGCVGLLVYENTLYVSSWNDGAVYKYEIK